MSGTNNKFEEFENFDNWAETVIKIWNEKINKLRIGHSGELATSFSHHVIYSAAGSLPRIEFFFLNYGRFVDMGVGRGYRDINYNYRGKLSGIEVRKKKPFYSPTAWAEYKKIGEYLMERYGTRASAHLIERMEKISIPA